MGNEIHLCAFKVLGLFLPCFRRRNQLGKSSSSVMISVLCISTQTTSQIFYLLQQNCLTANQLCGKSIFSKNACDKDIYSREDYDKNSGHVDKFSQTLSILFIFTFWALEVGWACSSLPCITSLISSIFLFLCAELRDFFRSVCQFINSLPLVLVCSLAYPLRQ